MQSTAKNSYSYSAFQVSPTQSVQTQSTLSRHSGRGGASKHPNNYSGSHMISRWFNLQANRSVLQADKAALPRGKMHTTCFRLLFYLPMESYFSSTNGLFFYYFIYYFSLFGWFPKAQCLCNWLMVFHMCLSVCSYALNVLSLPGVYIVNEIGNVTLQI